MEDVIRIDVAKAAKTLWKGKGKMLLAGLVCAGTVLGYSLATGPWYETAVTFFAGTPEQARQGAVLLELEQTVAEVEDLAGVEADEIRSEEVRETGFLRVTVSSENPADGKAVAEAVLEVLPRRAEEVLGFGVTAADDGVTEKVSVWAQVMAGFALGLLGCGGLVAGVAVLGKEKSLPCVKGGGSP